MKKRMARVFFIIITLIILICSSACNVTPEQSAHPTEGPSMGTSTSATVRYGMSDGQWGQFARYEYNQSGQLISVTTVSPFTLAPLMYETRKMDRVFVYSGDHVTRVWVGVGAVFEMTYSEDGRTATGVVNAHGQDTKLELKFNEKNILVSEKYSPISGESFYEYTYDDQGRIIRTVSASGSRFVTTHTYEGNTVSIRLTDESGNEIEAFALVVDDAGNPLSISAGGDESIVFSYENGKCISGVYNNKQTYKIEYEGDKLISTSTGEGKDEVREQFTYDGDKIVKYSRITTDTYLDGCASQSESFVYTYDKDGLMAEMSYVLVGYDADGNEVYKREE